MGRGEGRQEEDRNNRTETITALGGFTVVGKV